MKKRYLALTVLLAMALSMFAGCNGKAEEDVNQTEESVTLNVMTPFNDGDGNRQNFVTAYQQYEEASGNVINDIKTDAVNEDWKKKVLSDFESGNEPDVVFYFIGADADTLIQNEKLVPISDIRREYPDYASNMKESLMPVSSYDGRQYAVSIYGYWEGLFVNKKVLEACGVDMPGEGYTWDEFILDCEKIKDSGYVPIACSLYDVPHYWFEYCIFNNGSVSTHKNLPAAPGDEAEKSWAAGLNDIKELYDLGFFPENTLTAKESETSRLMLSGEAAFLLEGSWKTGWFLDPLEESESGESVSIAPEGYDPEDIAVTFVPAKGERESTDAIGGFSMGYCITKKAWDDPVRREASVEFVKAMTTDEVVSAFGELTVTALVNGVIPSGNLNLLGESALSMTKGCTAMIPAVQDYLNPEARKALFESIPKIVTGEISSEDAIGECLGIG